MERADLEAYCLGKRGAALEYPFGPEVAVYKVVGKIFALVPVEGEFWINLKCDPDFARVLRENYRDVTPAYHMNKRHWNSVRPNRGLPDDEIYDLIDHSYEQVVKGLTRQQRALLASGD